MTEEKKQSIQNEQESEVKPAEAQDSSEAKEEKQATASVDNEEKKEKSPRKDDRPVDETEDLPEDIKKKLEKNKLERAKNKKIRKKKKKGDRRVKSGKAYIKATYNNTIITLTDNKGDVISWASAGVAGFKGPKKATPYAAQIITKIACLKAKEEYGLEEVEVFVRGVGTGREAGVRALNANGLLVTSIKDITPIPHNGCRPKKPRRV